MRVKMHIQINAERLKIAFENKENFLKESNASQKVIEIISNWHLFSDFPILPETNVLLTKTEYFVICKFEEYLKENNEFKDVEEENNIVSLD